MTTREAWLLQAVEALRPDFEAAECPIPERVAVSVGWPYGTRKAIGQCWAAETSTDKAPAVFISPKLADPLEVLATLVHELVHAGGRTSHKADFGRAARALGLTGKMTATIASDGLRERLSALSEQLGTYGHAEIKVNALTMKTQGTRMLKVECPNGTGYKVRMTRKWLEDFGAPLCACCKAEMASEDAA